MIWLFWRDDTLHLATPDGLLSRSFSWRPRPSVLRHSSLAGRLAVLAQALATYAAFCHWRDGPHGHVRDAEVVSAVLLGLAALAGAFAVQGLLADRLLGAARTLWRLWRTQACAPPLLLALGCVIRLFLASTATISFGNRVDARVLLLSGR
ncbi:MAG: hypothetical protein HPM95_07060 [Alphaproteobacteria bacterium]|nr:hypothetical protein [Alphaproteobacteria bacterium]